MKLKRRTPTFTFTALLAVLTASCGSDPESAQVGQARMSLTTTSASGIGYRLRDAIFDLTGPQEVSVVSESYPTSEGAMVVPLQPGGYSVTLRDGFHMEYSTDGAGRNWASIDAELTSDNPTQATIVAEQTTRIPFAFEVDGALVTFGGEGVIAIEVTERGNRCAPPFHEVEAANVSGCAITNPSLTVPAYGCELESGYLSLFTCPSEMWLNNALAAGFSGAPYYTCYVPQEVDASVSPARCPIGQGTVTCRSGFVPDLANSRLSWGTGSAWGCYFRCVMDPDPKGGNADYPCTASGYVGQSMSDEAVCCRQW